MEIKYAAFDPGDHTGYALFHTDGSIATYGTVVGQMALYKLLDELPKSIQIVILENYKIYPWKAQAQIWSPMDTVRFIGAIEYWAITSNKQVEFQDAAIKAMGYKWAGIKKPKNKNLEHEADAYVHGVYWLQKTGIRTPQQGRAL